MLLLWVRTWLGLLSYDTAGGKVLGLVSDSETDRLLWRLCSSQVAIYSEAQPFVLSCSAESEQRKGPNPTARRQKF
jgi:hypothetical protein